MTNSYFDTPNWTRLARLTLARAEAVNAIADAIVTGFSLLPTPTEIKKQTITFVATDTGSATAYLVSQTYNPTTYTDGLEVVFRAANTNTGAATINVNAVGVIGIRDYAGNALTAGAITAGAIIQLRFDAINNYFRIINQQITYSGSVTITNTTPSYGVATGTNTYSVTPSPAPSALTAGLTVRVQFTNANTAASTINVNALGAASIVRSDGTALLAGDIPAGSDQTLIYDTASGGRWQMLGPVSNRPHLPMLAAMTM